MITLPEKVAPAGTSNELEVIDAIFQAVPSPLIIMTSAHKIVTVNKAVEQLFLLESHQMEGRCITELFPERFSTEVYHFLDQYQKDPGPKVHGDGWVLSCIRSDGSEFFATLGLQPYPGTDHKVIFSIKAKERIQVLGKSFDLSNTQGVEKEMTKLSNFQNIILDSTLYSIISTTDPHGIITTFNKGAEKMLGYKAEEMVGITSTAIIHDFQEVAARAKVLTEELGRPIEPGVDVFHIKAKLGMPDVNEWTYIHKNGTRITVELTVTTLRDSQNNITGYLGIARDISDEKRSAERVNKYARRLEEKNRELEQFTYIASHDLQEPLRTISNFGMLLSKHEAIVSDEIAGKYFHFIDSATKRMHNLIKCLLDYSRLGQRGNIEKVNFNEIIEAIKIDLDHTINETSALINAVKLPTVNGNKTELRLLIQNLVSNAIKFRKEQESPVINIWYEENTEYYKFNIQDNGIGIDEKHFKKVFLLFQRLQQHSKYQGHGIGLSHCKKIVECHGGKIGVSSKLNEGSTFFFTISKHKTI